MIKMTANDDLTNDQRRASLNAKAWPSKDLVTIDMLDKIVEEKLKMDITDKDVTSRIKNAFISYKSLLRQRSLSWVTQDNAKVAVYNVLSAIRPESLQQRLQLHIGLWRYESRKDFKKFL